MSNPRHEDPREQAWRLGTSPAEEVRLAALLAAHPKLRADLEDEADLNRLLQHLPESPVSSNFTARVLEAVDLEERRGARATGRLHSFSQRATLWLPRLGLAAIVTTAACLTFLQHRQTTRTELAQSLGTILVTVEALPDLEILRDFDAIQRLSQASGNADSDLLAALQP